MNKKTNKIDGPNWQRHEAEIVEKLGAKATACSGRLWHDGDGIIPGREVMLDCKATCKKSFSINNDTMKKYTVDAIVQSKLFILPVRLEADTIAERDYVVLDLDTFSQMLNFKKEQEEKVDLDSITKGLRELQNEIEDIFYDLPSLDSLESIMVDKMYKLDRFIKNLESKKGRR